MNMKWKGMLVLFSVALNIAFVADGIGHYILERQAHSHHDRFSAKGIEDAFYHRLDLSDAQHERIDHLLVGYAARQRELKKVNRRTRLELVRLIGNYKESDRPALMETIERMATIKKEREQLTAEHLLQVSAVLNDGQVERLFSRLLESIESEKE